MRQHSGIGVLDKAVEIIDAVTESPASLADLVERTGLPRATAHRLAVALELHGLLSRVEDGRFRRGPRFAPAAGSDPDLLVRSAQPILVQLRDECGESAQLYRREGDDRVCLATAERTTGLRTTVAVGSRLPLSAGSGAQVLRAWAVGTQVGVGVGVERSGFSDRLLADVRRRGWAQSVGQREAGVASVSAPVMALDSTVVAAISISGPIERLGRSPGARFAPPVVKAAHRLSAALRG